MSFLGLNSTQAQQTAPYVYVENPAHHRPYPQHRPVRKCLPQSGSSCQEDGHATYDTLLERAVTRPRSRQRSRLVTIMPAPMAGASAASWTERPPASGPHHGGGCRRRAGGRHVRLSLPVSAVLMERMRLPSTDPRGTRRHGGLATREDPPLQRRGIDKRLRHHPAGGE